MRKGKEIALTKVEKEEHVNKLMPLLKPLRYRLGISQDEVAQIMGVSRNFYNNIENNKTHLDWRYFLALLFFYSYNTKTRQMIEEANIISDRLSEWLNISEF